MKCKNLRTVFSWRLWVLQVIDKQLCGSHKVSNRETAENTPIILKDFRTWDPAAEWRLVISDKASWIDHYGFCSLWSIVVDGEAGFVGHAVLLPSSIQLMRAAALAKCTCRSLQPVMVKIFKPKKWAHIPNQDVRFVCFIEIRIVEQHCPKGTHSRHFQNCD